jgi:hypothetical protein
LTLLGQSEGVISVEDWAEIRRLHKSEGLAIKEITRQLGWLGSRCAPPWLRMVRPGTSAGSGSLVDRVEPQIRGLLAQTPTMPASVIDQRIGWEHSTSVLRARAAALQPLYAPADPADRTEPLPLL